MILWVVLLVCIVMVFLHYSPFQIRNIFQAVNNVSFYSDFESVLGQHNTSTHEIMSMCEDNKHKYEKTIVLVYYGNRANNLKL